MPTLDETSLCHAAREAGRAGRSIEEMRQQLRPVARQKKIRWTRSFRCDLELAWMHGTQDRKNVNPFL